MNNVVNYFILWMLLLWYWDWSYVLTIWKHTENKNPYDKSDLKYTLSTADSKNGGIIGGKTLYRRRIQVSINLEQVAMFWQINKSLVELEIIIYSRWLLVSICLEIIGNQDCYGFPEVEKS